MTGNIINLVRRDLYILMSVKTAGFTFLLFLILSVVTVSSLNPLSLFFLYLFIYIYIQNVFQLEETFRTEIFYASLPVRRRDIVIARYICVAIITIIYILSIYCTNALMLFLNIKDVQPIPVTYCVNVLLTLAITTSITYPLYFRLGITRAKAASNMLIGVVTAVAGAALGIRAAFLWTKSKGLGVVSAFLAGSIYPQSIITTMVLIGVAVILLGVTIPVTLALYYKKDL